MKLSHRSRTAPFLALDIFADALALEASGRDIIHMEVGEPAHGAPRAATARLEAAMRRGASLGYTAGVGLPELRSAIAGLYGRRYGVELDPARVVVTSGSSAAFQLAFLALFDAGERVAIADPGYPAYRNILGALGLEAVRLPATLGTRYQPTPELLHAAGPVSGLLVASPSNPAGTMLDRPALEALVDACARSGTALIADEIYHGVTYGARAVSALEITQDVAIINSFSKYYTMTGWRIGWMVLPPPLVRPVETLAQNLFICASHAAQIAALGALSPEGEAEAAGHLTAYADNRAAVISTLEALGFTQIAPCDGAFYAYAGLGDWGLDSHAFCAGLLRHEGVATTPGADFDPVRGAGTIRLSFAQSRERIAQAMARLRAYVAAGCPR